MKNRKRNFDDSFRRKIVTEYLTTDMSQKELHFKYGIKGKNNLSRWCKRFEYELSGIEAAKNGTLVNMKSKDNPKNIKKLTERIRELESALEEAELRAIAYQKLVENAEKELGIHLPKKSSTKQSKS